MTRLMEQAIERLRAVPETQQDQLAQFLINELEEDGRWAASTTANTDALQRRIQEVLADDARGMCEPLDPDAL
jgi:hypothetical protein